MLLQVRQCGSVSTDTSLKYSGILQNTKSFIWRVKLNRLCVNSFGSGSNRKRSHFCVRVPKSSFQRLINKWNQQVKKLRLCARSLFHLPVCALPLVERRRASGAVLAVLAAQSGRAGHVVVRHRRWLHRLQGLEGRVASAATRGGQGITITQ